MINIRYSIAKVRMKLVLVWHVYVLFKVIRPSTQMTITSRSIPSLVSPSHYVSHIINKNFTMSLHILTGTRQVIFTL